MTLDSLLRTTCEALERAGIPFMLTGSVASAFHGSSRSTMDIDFVIDPTQRQLAHLLSSIEASGSYVSREAATDALAQRTMFNVIDPESGWKADLIVRKERPFSIAEFARRQPVEFFGTSLHVASLEDVMLSKLEWARLGGSARQIADVRELQRINLEQLNVAYLERWIEALGLTEQWAAVRRTP